jgi:prepilin-type N-terminal cleavage/methylation domain-containing protein
MRNRHRGAFTLVELLVVIGIIAVLIAVLLPALGRARTQANIVNCASNLRQVATSIMLYADSNKGLLPPHFMPSGGLTPESCYMVKSGNTPTSPVFSFGTIYRARFITTPKVFYCPAFPRHDFDYSSFPEPWLDAILSPGPYDTWRTSYLYMPHSTDESNARPRYKKFKEIPKDKTLAMDIAFDASSTSHSGRNPSWNLAFSDGHVSTVISRFCYDVMQGKYVADPLGAIQGGNTQKDFQKGSINSGVRNFDTYRDILETTAVGRDPKTSTVGGGKAMSNQRMNVPTSAPPPPPGI